VQAISLKEKGRDLAFCGKSFFLTLQHHRYSVLNEVFVFMGNVSEVAKVFKKVLNIDSGDLICLPFSLAGSDNNRLAAS